MPAYSALPPPCFRRADIPPPDRIICSLVLIVSSGYRAASTMQPAIAPDARLPQTTFHAGGGFTGSGSGSSCFFFPARSITGFGAARSTLLRSSILSVHMVSLGDGARGLIDMCVLYGKATTRGVQHWSGHTDHQTGKRACTCEHLSSDGAPTLFMLANGAATRRLCRRSLTDAAAGQAGCSSSTVSASLTNAACARLADIAIRAIKFLAELLVI